LGKAAPRPACPGPSPTDSGVHGGAKSVPGTLARVARHRPGWALAALLGQRPRELTGPAKDLQHTLSRPDSGELGQIGDECHRVAGPSLIVELGILIEDCAEQLSITLSHAGPLSPAIGSSSCRLSRGQSVSPSCSPHRSAARDGAGLSDEPRMPPGPLTPLGRDGSTARQSLGLVCPEITSRRRGQGCRSRRSTNRLRDARPFPRQSERPTPVWPGALCG
jgi:hypothetical protein